MGIINSKKKHDDCDIGVKLSKPTKNLGPYLTKYFNINKRRIKLVTYNVRIILSILDIKKTAIKEYINSKITEISQEKDIIICIQGIDDDAIKKYLYNIFSKTLNIIHQDKIGQLIFSNLNYVSYGYHTFTNKSSFSFKPYGLLYMNFVIDNNIISVYSVHLHEDMYRNVLSSRAIRKNDVAELKDVISKNAAKTSNLSNMSDVHFIVGTFNIPEFVKDVVSEEYKELIEETDFIDIYRMNNTDIGNTCKDEDERIDYIFMYLHKKEINKEMMTTKDFIDVVYDSYNIELTSAKIEKYVDISTHTPVKINFNVKQYNSITKTPLFDKPEGIFTLSNDISESNDINVFIYGVIKDIQKQLEIAKNKN